MSKRVIVTSAIGPKYEALWQVTGPTVEQYADRIGADLMVIKENPHAATAHWVKFVLYELLHKRYKRAAWIDADVIIRPDTPDLFEEVPEDKLGMFNEGRFTPRSIALYEAMSAYKVRLPHWDRKSYYNSGVMVVSRDQRHLFGPPEIRSQKYSFGEQTYLNLRLFERQVPVHELDHRFNYLSCLNAITGTSRLSAFIVHYAGYEILNPGLDLKALIQEDLRRWEKDTPFYLYQPTLYIHIGGGLGDQVCAEPVLRFIRETLYPEADIYAQSAYPELFQHIQGLKVSKVPIEIQVDAVRKMSLHPDQDTGHGKYTLNVLTHPVDYISMEALERTLPASQKRIRLQVDQEGLEEVWAVDPDPTDLILVHPGVGWPSKTFPTAWWQAVADGLTEAGFRVGVIGRDLGIKDDRGMTHAYQPMTVPPNGVDFRDRLSTKGLIALLSMADLLISNDSGPIHIAGAFENHIILIPTCKHPEHLLPYRHGSQWYKAAALYKALACEEYNFRPTEVLAMSISQVKRPILDYLPDPETVIKQTKEMMARAKAELLPVHPSKGEKSNEYHYLQPYPGNLCYGLWREDYFFGGRQPSQG